MARAVKITKEQYMKIMQLNRKERREFYRKHRKEANLKWEDFIANNPNAK